MQPAWVAWIHVPLLNIARRLAIGMWRHGEGAGARWRGSRTLKTFARGEEERTLKTCAYGGMA